MASTLTLDWWPSRQLHEHPVKKVIVCGRRLHPPLFSHVVNFPRLEIPLRGSYENLIESGDETVKTSVRPGMVLFAAPNCWNLPEWRPGLELLTISFGRTQTGISLISHQGRSYTELNSKKYSLQRPLTGPIPHILNALGELQAAGAVSQPFEELVRCLIWCVEDLLRQPVAPTSGRALKLLEDIRVFLQSHYQYEITRDSVAEQFGITPNHLSRLFQTHGQMTFSKYLTLVRIDRAKHLLQSYNLKMDDIAARCGYHDTPYFCHVFKHFTKCTPAEYRLKSRTRLAKPEGQA